MEELQKLFGDLPLTKIGAYVLAPSDKQVDVYMAKISRGRNTDKTVAIMMTKHNVAAAGVVRLGDLEWESFHVRSYPSAKALSAGISDLKASELLASLKPVKLQKVNWGNAKDIVMTSSDFAKNRATYVSEGLKDMQITLYASDPDGADLEIKMELIPMLQSYNFCVQRLK